MKRLLVGLVLCLVFVGAAHAQEDPFNGTWKVDLAKSNGEGLPTAELVILEVSNNIEHGTNDITFADGTRYQSEYTAPYNDGKWHTSHHPETGEPSRGKTMMVRMDERSVLRIGQNASGKMNSMIMRQVSEDGNTMRIVWYQADGSIYQQLHLDKQ
ncbi:MAG TPA: hypothetical protein QGG47_13715 [Acidobacteriota bacterium]|nr:hypothetical protein [Acidobacteriota bacterium]